MLIQNFLAHPVSSCTSSLHFWFLIRFISRLHASMCVYMPYSKHKNIKLFGWCPFLNVTRSWSRYLKDAFDSGLCNRKKIRNVRHTNPILSTEMSDSCVFSTSKIWHPNQTRKFYENLHFLLENFFSNASKIFFMSPTRMFKVSKRCVLPSSLRRKKNESHPTHRSKYFWKKLTPPKLFFFGGGDRLNESLTWFGATCIGKSRLVLERNHRSLLRLTAANLVISLTFLSPK